MGPRTHLDASCRGVADAGRFFANISHEFRTPLTLILGPVESTLEGRYGALPAPLDTPLRRIRHQARRLLRLVEQLLDLSRLEHGRLELQSRPRDLVSFLRRQVRAFHPLAERREVRLAFRPEEESILARFDADQIEKVVSNLLSNALKFTRKGGKVFVTAGRRDFVNERWAEFAVRDTGPGIPSEDLERIFDRFEQVDGAATRRHGGTGIGLSLARELVDLHGGKLLVESEQGFGSTFLVRLPLAGEDEIVSPAHTMEDTYATTSGIGVPDANLPVVASDMQAGDVGDGAFSVPPRHDDERPTVLVVEDNAEVRAYLREHLEGRYRVVEAADGVEGLARARREPPDLVLSDVMMPEMDGLAMCTALRADQRLSHIPVLLLTARAADEDVVEGLGGGADDYLAKPFGASELLARVERLIQTRRQLQERYRGELKVEPAGVVVDSAEEAFVRQVLDAVEAHLSDSTFGAEALADAVGVSRRQLTRKLKQLVGEAPSDLLRRMRLERASQLLEAEAGTVSEIAYGVGFKSPSHFTRTFRKRFGCTPTEFSRVIR